MLGDGSQYTDFGPIPHTHTTTGGKTPLPHSAAAPASFPFALPKYTAPVVSRQVRHAAEAYLAIVSAATQSDKPEDLRDCLAKHAEALAAVRDAGCAWLLLLLFFPRLVSSVLCANND